MKQPNFLFFHLNVYIVNTDVVKFVNITSTGFKDLLSMIIFYKYI